MKAKIFLFFSVFFLIACKKESTLPQGKSESVSETIQYQHNAQGVQLHSGKFSYSFSPSQLPLKKIILLNASLVGYFTELQAEQKIIGISSPEYVYSSKIHQQIQAGKTFNVGNEQKYDTEKIIAAKPDAVFTNYIQIFDNTYDLLRKNGIKVIFIDEYLLQKPLEKAALLKLFGVLLGVSEKADAQYAAIEKEYHLLHQLAANTPNRPGVLTNEIYGSQWFLPGGHTAVATFIQDAGGRYVLKDNAESKAVPFTFEEVLSMAADASCWINVSPHSSKQELLTLNPVYAKMPVFQKGKIYTMGGRVRGSSNDFFESGVVRADLVLKDYIRIFHPDLLPQYALTYMKELK